MDNGTVDRIVSVLHKSHTKLWYRSHLSDQLHSITRHHILILVLLQMMGQRTKFHGVPQWVWHSRALWNEYAREQLIQKITIWQLISSCPILLKCHGLSTDKATSPTTWIFINSITRTSNLINGALVKIQTVWYNLNQHNHHFNLSSLSKFQFNVPSIYVHILAFPTVHCTHVCLYLLASAIICKGSPRSTWTAAADFIFIAPICQVPLGHQSDHGPHSNNIWLKVTPI